MPADNKLELVVEVDVNKANASIKSINTGLSSTEQAAGKAARIASAYNEKLIQVQRYNHARKLPAPPS